MGQDTGKQNEHVFMSLLPCFNHLQNILHILQDFLGVPREGKKTIGTKEDHESGRDTTGHTLLRVRQSQIL